MCSINSYVLYKRIVKNHRNEMPLTRVHYVKTVVSPLTGDFWQKEVRTAVLMKSFAFIKYHKIAF